MSLQDIDEIENTIERLRGMAQTVDNVRKIADLEVELRVMKAERELVVAKRAKLLYHAFWDNGGMRAMHPSGARLDYDGSPHHVDDIVKIWNVQSQANTLASWSEP